MPIYQGKKRKYTYFSICYKFCLNFSIQFSVIMYKAAEEGAGEFLPQPKELGFWGWRELISFSSLRSFLLLFSSLRLSF